MAWQIERDRLTLDVMKKANTRKRIWYHENLLKVLEAQKERRTKDIDTTIGIARELQKALEDLVPKPREVQQHPIHIHEDDSSMRPVEPEIRDILYGPKKGAREKYLKARYKKRTEDRYYCRLCTSWDYGWAQGAAHVPARDVNFGRRGVVRDTFYRARDLRPEPPHRAQPSGGNCSICSDEYYCYFN